MYKLMVISILLGEMQVLIHVQVGLTVSVNTSRAYNFFSPNDLLYLHLYQTKRWLLRLAVPPACGSLSTLFVHNAFSSFPPVLNPKNFQTVTLSLDRVTVSLS